MANLPWWELLKDETLQELIRTALMENLDLQIATANIEQFQAQLMIAKFDLVPSLLLRGHRLRFSEHEHHGFPGRRRRAFQPVRKNGLSLSTRKPSASASSGNWICGGASAARSRQPARNCCRNRKISGR